MIYDLSSPLELELETRTLSLSLDVAMRDMIGITCRESDAICFDSYQREIHHSNLEETIVPFDVPVVEIAIL